MVDQLLQRVLKGMDAAENTAALAQLFKDARVEDDVAGYFMIAWEYISSLADFSSYVSKTITKSSSMH